MTYFYIIFVFVYHGFKSNDKVREALQNAHILAYPSIWEECNSRSLIESMSAGLLCVDG